MTPFERGSGASPVRADVVDSFEDRAERCARSVAVEFEGDELTYAELDRLADGVAATLVERGCAPGERVVVCVDPSPRTAIAILGVLKAGATYVPMASSDPIERIGYVCADTGARLLLTEEDHLARVERLVSDPIALDRVGESTGARPERSADPARIAYVLYTSGSSGRPKGVEVPHGSLAYYLRWHIEHLRPAAGDLDLPLSSSTCFAAGVTQFYTPLLLGRTQHVLPRDTMRDPERVFAWYGSHPGYGLYCVPTLWNQLLRFAERRIESGEALTGPRCVLLSGEAVSPKLVERSVGVWPELRLWNLYGPTEAVANASAGELRPGSAPTIGAPIAGTRIYLVDEHMREVGPGETGELCISGPGVARGYLNLPEATRQRFLADPFDDTGERRMFRSGDVARRDERGELIFEGRQDAQVKVRGHRVECAEVERTLERHTAVRDAVVLLREGRLVAYLTFRMARYASVQELRSFLTESLPDHMVPAAFVVVDALPQLANGKLDRRRLPAPGSARPDLGYGFEPPGSVRESQLIRIWEESLRIDGVGATDDFFDLGGDSLGAASAIARIRDTLKLSPSYRLFFDNPTPRALAAALEGRHGAEASEPIARLPLMDSYPCSESQRSVWLLMETFPEVTAYNMQFSLALEGELDTPALAGALDDALARHDVLRATIHADRGRPVMKVRRAGDSGLTAVDLRHLDPAERESEAERLRECERERRFDLGAGPLLRPVLHRLEDDRHRLTVTVHHLVFDGRSINIFCRDLLECYRARRLQLPLAAPALQYQDWCASQEESQRAGDGGEHVEFWRDYLSGCPQLLDLPTDYARPPVRGFEGASRSVRVGPELKAAVRKLARTASATPFMALFAAFNVLLHRLSGQDDILVGCPVANRERPGAEELLGFLANTIVLRTRLTGEESFDELLTTTRESCLAALAHQGVAFETLLELVRPERNLSQAPIFQVMFGYHEQPFRGAVDGLSMRASDDGTGGAKYDLVLDVLDSDDTWELRLTYRTDLYDERTIERWLGQYVRLLAGITEDAAAAVTEHELIGDADRAELSRWNRTKHDNERSRTLHRLFEEQAARTPERTALVDGEQHLTYAELDGRANGLAARIASAGVAEGALVGLHLEASADMIVALLAVLKAGGAYVPLDPYYPPARIADAIEDSGLRVIVAHSHLAGRLPVQGETVVAIEADLGAANPSSPAPPLPGRVDPRGLMYVMYTSGSTGRPKGVMVPHEGAANYVLWMRDTFALSPDDKVLSKTSINFDISVWEIFLPLVSGAQLVVSRQEELQAPDTLAALIRREGVTTIQFVPSALRAFVDSGRLPGCDSLTRIFSGGEALPLRLEQEVLEASPAELHNLYGPTEASIYSAHWVCSREDRRLRSVPIGRPIHNTQVHILDAHMRPVPIGTTGDLYIGGAGVADGYLGQPELTAAAFPPDPFSDREDARLFRTNDRARFLNDGSIEFFGRSDSQVKVRGYRVELGEVAHHLSAHPQVRHAIVIVREDQADDVRLVAYMLYEQQSGPGDEELRSYLKQKLPDHMIPAAFVALDSIPMLPNSKANIAALPKPEYTKTLRSALDRTYGDERERVLAEIWEEVLQTSRFGPEDSFFEVGGHSLLVARLGALIEERLGVEISNVELFQFPTVRSMARRLGSLDQPANGVVAEMAKRAAGRNGRRSVARPTAGRR